MPGIITSSSTRLGASFSIFSSASAPPAARATAEPRPDRRQPSSSPFTGRPSTRRIFSGIVLLSAPLVENLTDRVDELLHLDRLALVSVEAGGHDLLAVVHHRRR